MIHEVEITHDDYTRVYVDGKEVRRVREISFHESIEEAPTITLDICDAPSFKGEAIVDLTISDDPYVKWLMEEIEKRKDDSRYVLKECLARYLASFVSKEKE